MPLPDNSQTDKRGFKAKRWADHFVANVEGSKSRGEFVFVSQSRIAVSDGAEHWLATQIQLQLSTRNGCESIVKSAIIPKWSATPLDGLTHAGIQKWLAETSSYAARPPARCGVARYLGGRQREDRAEDSWARLGGHDSRCLGRPLRRPACRKKMPQCFGCFRKCGQTAKYKCPSDEYLEATAA